MKFIALKTCEGGAKGRISFCCKALKVTRQGFHEYLKNRNKPWKHEELAAKMMEILSEDECNDTYGREQMHKALLLKYPNSGIPSETTVYRVMTAIGITHRPNRKPNGITKADREARKSDDLLKRDFKADKPFSKCVTDITEVKAKNGKLYVSAIFDCYDLTAVNGQQYESRTVRCNCREYSGSVSRILRCGTPRRPRKPVHKRFIQSHAERVWRKAKHEQRRRQMS